MVGCGGGWSRGELGGWMFQNPWLNIIHTFHHFNLATSSQIVVTTVL
jgi:hypothetical protein